VKLEDQHLYHGAALTQIAEDDEFTAINPLDLMGKRLSSAFRINDNIGVHLKYNSVKPKANGEFPFTFSQDNLKELTGMTEQLQLKKVFVVLVCFVAREVCVVTLQRLREMIAIREQAAGKTEDQYVVLVTAPKNSKLRVYLNAPGTKGKLLRNTETKVARNSFPGVLFQP
jgi:hypothetical protein